MEKEKQPEVVILGGGLGGTIAAFDLHKKLSGRARIRLISDSPAFSFVPSNPWVALGWRKAEAVQVDLQPVLERKGIAFTPVAATRLEPRERRIQLADGTSASYDFLVIATGPELAFNEIEGLGPKGYTHSICRTDHAEEAGRSFERFCADPGPIVVGAVQGASCFGPAYEFAMMLDTELRRRKIRDKVPMTFVTSEPYIGHLGLDGVGDTKGLLESELRSRHIKWITNAKVQRVSEGALYVERLDSDEAEPREIPFRYAMLLPAFRGIAALQGIDGLVNPRGFVIVDRFQRNPSFPDIFALGVCIAIPPQGQTPVPVGVPKTGFMIESMSAAIAANISDLIDGHQAWHEATWNAICLADFGDGGVAFVAQPQIPPRNLNWSAKGRWVHFAKAAFERYFLRKIRRGLAEPAYERLAFRLMKIGKIRSAAPAPFRAAAHEEA